MIRKISLIFFLVGIALFFGTCKAAKSVDVEYQVYSVVIGKDVKDFIILDKTSIQWIPSSSSSELSFGKEYLGLQEDFISKNRGEHVIERRFSIAGNYVVVSEKDLNETLKARSDSRYYQFSRVGFSKDGNKALVYAGMSCGPLCGDGAYFLLSKKENIWEIIEKSEIWVS